MYKRKIGYRSTWSPPNLNLRVRFQFKIRAGVKDWLAVRAVFRVRVRLFLSIQWRGRGGLADIFPNIILPVNYNEHELAS